MEADLTVPAPPVADSAGYRISSWVGIDDDEIREAHNIAFGDHPGFTPLGHRDVAPRTSAAARAYRPRALSTWPVPRPGRSPRMSR